MYISLAKCSNLNPLIPCPIRKAHPAQVIQYFCYAAQCSSCRQAAIFKIEGFYGVRPHETAITWFCKFSVKTLWASLQTLGNMVSFVQNVKPIDLGSDWKLCSVGGGGGQSNNNNNNNEFNMQMLMAELFGKQGSLDKKIFTIFF